MPQNEPRWLEEARKHTGLKEIKGPSHNPLILQFWKDIRRSGIQDDETPWCAAFTGAMLERAGIRSTRFESAKSYLDWGTELKAPLYGCVVVSGRQGGGHVGFVVGEKQNGDLMVLGGNQGDAVSICAFSRDRVLGYRWPENEPQDLRPLPVMDGQRSVSEA